MSDFAVFAEGLTELQDFAELKRDIRLAATRAINKIARDKRSRAARLIRDQVNFPAAYVAPGQKRLYVSKQANRSDLEARITARGRATSLARFTDGGQVGHAGVYVQVAPGKSRFMKRAFLMRLPQGSTLTDTIFNLGLAIRLRPGEVLQNKVSARKVASGLYLLYGPSVDQVFRSNDGSGVANDMVPEIERDLSAEFLRLLDI
jgi:hypothetical protein